MTRAYTHLIAFAAICLAMVVIASFVLLPS